MGALAISYRMSVIAFPQYDDTFSWSYCELNSFWCFGPISTEDGFPSSIHASQLAGSIAYMDGVEQCSSLPSSFSYKLMINLSKTDHSATLVVETIENNEKKYCTKPFVSSPVNFVNPYYSVATESLNAFAKSDVMKIVGEDSFFVVFHSRKTYERPSRPSGISICECGDPSWCYGPLTTSNLHHIRNDFFGRKTSDWSFLNMVSYPSPNQYCDSNASGGVEESSPPKQGIVYYPRIERGIFDIFHHFEVNNLQMTSESFSCRSDVIAFIDWVSDDDRVKKSYTRGHAACMNIGSFQVPNYKALVWHGDSGAKMRRRGK
eukprot:GDKK01037846.1.p1 GENE.GDKK01037846.1~~GDKK01037846.1.p1  ORF type:complete len:319 (+),score=25.15 GDKK01037846.1:33-989(+)